MSNKLEKQIKKFNKKIKQGYKVDFHKTKQVGKRTTVALNCPKIDMTKEAHKQRHLELHQAFDELLADFINHSPKTKVRLPSEHTVMELAEWSFQQTKNPDSSPSRLNRL